MSPTARRLKQAALVKAIECMSLPSSRPRGSRGLRSLTQNGINGGGLRLQFQGYSLDGRVRRIRQTYDSAKQGGGTEYPLLPSCHTDRLSKQVPTVWEEWQDCSRSKGLA